MATVKKKRKATWAETLHKTKLMLDGFKAVHAWAFHNERTVLFKGNATYFNDGLATRHHVGFLHDEKFQTAFNGAFDLIPPHLDFSKIAWRAHIATWAASQAVNLNGDFVECGVWYGVLSRTICNYVDFRKYPGKFYLIDSWGLEGSITHKRYQDDIYETVKQRFSDIPNAEFIRELVPEALARVPSTRIAYLSIDMNGSVAEKAALEFFYDKIVPGGIIYFDDYGWNHPELRKIVDEFFSDKPETLLHFPSGNSIVVKI